LLLLAALASCVDGGVQNAPPQLSDLPVQVRVHVGEAVDLTVTATDPDGDPVTISLQQAPPGAEFISPGGLGRFHWSPIASDAAGGEQAHDVIFLASDGRGGTDSARVSVLVVPTDGSPRFATGGQTVLDLGQTDTLDLAVTVKDDNSARVDIFLAEGPKGMALQSTGNKSARLTWTPDADQIQSKPVWGAVLGADDGVSGVVTQDLSVIIIRKMGGCDETAGCGCNPPTIAHNELPDQRGVNDYEIIAAITDNESAVQSATLFWTDGDPADRANFNAVPMSQAGGSDWLAPIPNPLLKTGESRQIFYFICALDNDDASGAECDNLICQPAETAFSFTAYPLGDNSCADDHSEPNDAPATSTLLVEESLLGLTICPGDEDWFAIEVGNNEGVDFLMAHTTANGNLDLEAYDQDGSTLLTQSISDDDNEYVRTQPRVPGVYFFRVFGQPNSYDIIYDLYDINSGDCTDGFEPNDSIAQATNLNPGSYPGLRLCSDEVDLYSMTLEQGDTLDLTIRFSHLDGDLDLRLLNQTGTETLARSLSATDDESITFTASVASTVLLEVTGFLGDSADYAFEFTVDSNNNECVDDNLEPNDSRFAASDLAPLILESGIICPGNLDVWSFTLSNRQRGRVTIEFNGDLGDLDLTLFDDFELELDSSAGIGDSETVAHTASGTMEIFAQVEGFRDQAGGYTIGLEVCDNDDSDPNDTRNDAALLEGQLTNRVLCLGEDDWYLVGFDPHQETTIVVTTNDSEEVQMSLTTDTGAVLTRGQRDGDDMTITWTTQDSDILLVRVQSNRPSGDPITYSVSKQ
jgi:hypothetical protein